MAELVDIENENENCGSWDVAYWHWLELLL